MKYNLKTTIDAFGLGGSLMGIISGYNRSTCVITFLVFIMLLVLDTHED